jgi:multiple sugar transport system permease protein
MLHAVLLLGAALTLAPLFWMVAASFMPAGEANTYPPRFWPSRPTLEHYATLFTSLDLARGFWNSLIVTIGSTALSVWIVGMAGYAFAKLRFRGRDRLFGFLLAGLVVPAQVGMLPLFLLLRSLGLVNTIPGIMIPYLASIFGIFMVRQYALGIPNELLDAARVDGAGEWRIFRTVALPAMTPILATLAVFNLLSAWNDFLWPLIVASDASNFTLPVALANLVGEHVQDTELMMAGAVITVLPVLAVFLLLQRFYFRGIWAGSVKS